MNKLETIKKILTAKSNTAWMEEMSRLPYHRSRPGYYYSYGIRIVPKDPLPDAPSLIKFSESLIQELIPLEPSSISHCYVFSTRRKTIRLGTLYFLDIGEGENDVESRLVVSIYPCETMSKNVGYRAILEMGGYLCLEPCSVAKKCKFKMPKHAYFETLLRP